ncbi:MAG: hypothetical protein WBZ36_26725 [Candidatus Nitrosopolaris sp.]
MIRNKTISLLVLTMTLVTAALVTGINSIPTVKAATNSQNAFGAAVSGQAQNQASPGAFGEHQSDAAHANGGLGSLNCATCTPLK